MQDLYKRLLEFTHDAIYRYTLDQGEIIEANQGLVDVLDLDCRPGDLVGKRLRDVLIYVRKEGQVREAVATKHEIHGFEYHFRTLKGEDKWVIHDSFLTDDPERGCKVVEAIAKDITASKLAELEVRRLNRELDSRVRRRTAQLKAANRELEAFAYSVSHDLRAPLRHIDGFSQALLQDCADRLDDKGKDYLERIRANSQRMGALIDDLLTLSRLTRADMQVEDVDMSSMLEELAAELKETEPDRKAHIKIQPCLRTRADPELLRAALRNLLSNAWKFTSREPETKIKVGCRTLKGRPVYFVSDNGVGFDMKFADSMFGAFRRLHKQSEFPGTGIGLASVQRVILRHGGRVWAESREGEGATFFFTLHQE